MWAGFEHWQLLVGSYLTIQVQWFYTSKSVLSSRIWDIFWLYFLQVPYY